MAWLLLRHVIKAGWVSGMAPSSSLLLILSRVLEGSYAHHYTLQGFGWGTFPIYLEMWGFEPRTFYKAGTVPLSCLYVCLVFAETEMHEVLSLLPQRRQLYEVASTTTHPKCNQKHASDNQAPLATGASNQGKCLSKTLAQVTSCFPLGSLQNVWSCFQMTNYSCASSLKEPSAGIILRFGRWF